VKFNPDGSSPNISRPIGLIHPFANGLIYDWKAPNSLGFDEWGER